MFKHKSSINSLIYLSSVQYYVIISYRLLRILHLTYWFNIINQIQFRELCTLIHSELGNYRYVFFKIRLGD